MAAVATGDGTIRRGPHRAAPARGGGGKTKPLVCGERTQGPSLPSCCPERAELRVTVKGLCPAVKRFLPSQAARAGPGRRGRPQGRLLPAARPGPALVFSPEGAP